MIKVFVLFVATVNCEYASNVIDVDDILAEDFMPGTLLVLENPTNGIKHFNGSIKNIETMEKVPDGSFRNAMETMNFHRSMMNQYLCRNFVAEQIIKDMTISRVNRRMGHITPGSEPTKFKSAAQSNLLNDEGSSHYKTWLTKSATLEDLYRHYDQAQNRIDAEIIEEDDKGEDFDEEYNGHVTGYVYPQSHEGQTSVKHRGHTGLGMYYAGGGGYPYPNAVYHHHAGGSDYHHGGGSGYPHGGSTSGYHYSGGSGSHGGDSGYHHSAGGGGGYSHDGGYGDGDYSHHDSSGGGHAVVETIYHSNPPKYHGQHESSYGGKDHDLSDLFDIALTALAFLSFGLFIVHVIMCISAATNSTTTTAASMMMPMSMSPTATATGTGTGTGDGTTGDGSTGTGGGTTSTGTGSAAGTGTGSGRDTFKFRLRRGIPTITNPNNQALNELARRVLTSIEAALVANSDNGVCLQKSLCENNKYSRNLESNDKIIIPMWSLGMSWLAGRLVKNVTSATSMLDTLKASILGLGRANCEIIYQDCDLRRERKKRKRRRRK